MSSEPAERIDAGALKVWRLSGSIFAAVCAVPVLILLILTIRFDWPIWIFAAAFLSEVAIAVLSIAVMPKFEYEQWRYSIHEYEIELQHGIVFRKHTLIPMIRVQNVDTKQGPLLRRYGLATVTLATAAGSHEIPALSVHTAEQVRRQIAAFARISYEEI